MVMVAILALKSRFCTACDGRGHRQQMVGVAVHKYAICPDCEGSGDIPDDYFIEAGTPAEVEELVDRLLSEGV